MKYWNILSLVACVFLLLIANTRALEVSGAKGEYITTSLQLQNNYYGQFFVNRTDFVNNVFFVYDKIQQKLFIIVKIPDISVGEYTFPIWVKYAYQGENGSYRTSTAEVSDLTVEIKSMTQTVKDITLPDSGFMKSGYDIKSTAGFSLRPIAGENMVILRTTSCSDDAINISYGKEEKIECGDCDVYFTPEYKLMSYGDELMLKVSIRSNCYNYAYFIESSSGSGYSGDCGEIQILATGYAYRGKSLLIHTVDQNGNDIVANVFMNDASGNQVALQTNSPIKGYGNVVIPEDSDPPIVFLASKDGCKNGKLEIFDIRGQKLSSKIQKELVITLPETAKVNEIIEGEVKDDEGNKIPNTKDLIHIVMPDGSVIKTNTNTDGKFKFLIKESGDYIFYADGDDGISGNYTVSAEIEKKNLSVTFFIDNKPAPMNELHVGDIVDVRLLVDGNVIEEDLNATVYSDKTKDEVRFLKGILENLKIEGENVRIKIRESEKYNSITSNIIAKQSFSSALVAIVVIAVLGLLAFVKLKPHKKRKRKKHVNLEEDAEVSFLMSPEDLEKKGR